MVRKLTLILIHYEIYRRKSFYQFKCPPQVRYTGQFLIRREGRRLSWHSSGRSSYHQRDKGSSLQSRQINWPEYSYHRDRRNSWRYQVHLFALRLSDRLLSSLEEKIPYLYMCALFALYLRLKELKSKLHSDNKGTAFY